MEKQKPQFEETRQQQFHRLYPHHYRDMEEKLKIGTQWAGNATRQRVRALARQETRLHVRQLREK